MERYDKEASFRKIILNEPIVFTNRVYLKKRLNNCIIECLDMKLIKRSNVEIISINEIMIRK